jgi:ligand-binding SRPBCC domain-containing protein
MPVFDYKFTVHASLQELSDFHRDTSALKKLTPPPTIVQLHESEPMEEGSVSRFTLWVGPLPLRWKAVHRGVSERGFTDVDVHIPKTRHTLVSASLIDMACNLIDALLPLRPIDN